MIVVFAKNFSKEAVLGMVDGLDDKFVISREIEKASAFARGPELGKNVFAGEGHEVVCRVETEYCS